MLSLSRLVSQDKSQSTPIARGNCQPENCSNKNRNAAARSGSAESAPKVPPYLLSEREWVRQFGY